jgi:protocatechuate 3,4-dioxygenase beta subunit
MDISLPRRALLRILGVAGALAGMTRPAAALTPTPPQSTGPFYPPAADRFADTDWDLVKIAGNVRASGGQVMHLAGRVLDSDGAPVSGALIEIWQCDANGRYLHSGDVSSTRQRDPDFQGYGVTRSDGEGRYRFRTIVPVEYPGRTPHIHARIGRPDGSGLTTQIYLEDHPLNQRDFLFRRLGKAAQQAASIAPVALDSGDMEAAFDFIV